MISPDGIARWRRFAISAAVVAALLVLFAPTTRTLVQLWLDTGETTYTHGFLIAAISLWLLWRGAPREHALMARVPVPLVGLGLLCGVLLWEMSYLAGIQLGATVLLPLLLWGAVFLVQGASAANAAAFPLAFLYFAIPVWDLFNGTAQSVTVWAVRLLLRLTDVPAFVNGNFVQIRSGTFQIAGGCSGLHFIIVALALSALLGELRGDGWRWRIRWLATGLLLAVLTNWVRVYTIILAGHLTDMQHYIVRVSHYGYGWALFAIAVVILFALERRAPPPAAPRPAEPSTPRRAPRAVFGGALAALLLAALPTLFNLAIEARMRRDASSAAVAKPRNPPAGWGAIGGVSTWQPVQVGADHLRREHYRRGNAEVELVVADYRELAQGRELGGFSNHPGGDAEILDAARRGVDGHAVSELHLAAHDGEALVWIEYRVAGRRFASATAAQFWYGWVTLWSLRPPPSTVLLIRAPCVSRCDAARAVLVSFLTGMGDST